MFLRRQPEPGSEVACVFEVAYLTAGRCDHGGGGEQTDAGDRQQCRAGSGLTSELTELFLQITDAHFEQSNLIDHRAHGGAQQLG
jgi:hypothetical protein